MILNINFKLLKYENNLNELMELFEVTHTERCDGLLKLEFLYNGYEYKVEIPDGIYIIVTPDEVYFTDGNLKDVNFLSLFINI